MMACTVVYLTALFIISIAETVCTYERKDERNQVRIIKWKRGGVVDVKNVRVLWIGEMKELVVHIEMAGYGTDDDS